MQQMHHATDSTSVQDIYERAGQLLDVTPLVMRAIRLYMRAEGAKDLSVPQFRALGYIGRHPSTSLSDVAEHAGLTLAAASRLVDGLVGRDLVVREAAVQDRRYLALRLSSSGSDLLALARQHALAALAERLAILSPETLAQIATAQEALRALFSNAPEPVAASPASRMEEHP